MASGEVVIPPQMRYEVSSRETVLLMEREIYLGLPHVAHVTSTPTFRRASPLLPLPHKSQLLASSGSSSSLTQSRLDFAPPTYPLYIETSIAIIRHIASLRGSADGHSLTLQSNAFTNKTAATGDPLGPNFTRSCFHLDCERSPIKGLPKLPNTDN